jgi:hypothetical protein
MAVLLQRLSTAPYRSTELLTPRAMNSTNDFAIYCLLLMFVACYEVISIIIEVAKTGIFISQKQLLLQKRNAELKEILIQLGIAPKRMNKMQMVEAILAI